MKTKHDYAALDVAIFAALKNKSPLPRHALFYGNVFSECVRAAVAAQAYRLRSDKWRVFTGRLQALRKAGKISYSRKPEGWSLAKTGGAS